MPPCRYPGQSAFQGAFFRLADGWRTAGNRHQRQQPRRSRANEAHLTAIDIEKSVVKHTAESHKASKPRSKTKRFRANAKQFGAKPIFDGSSDARPPFHAVNASLFYSRFSISARGILTGYNRKKAFPLPRKECPLWRSGRSQSLLLARDGDFVFFNAQTHLVPGFSAQNQLAERIFDELLQRHGRRFRAPLMSFTPFCASSIATCGS